MGQIRDVKEGLKESWGNGSQAKRWWWEVGGGSSYGPDDSKQIPGAGKHP